MKKTNIIKVGNFKIKLKSHPNVFMPSKRSIIFANKLAEINFFEKNILDVGTGSGIFAIVAGLRGAKDIVVSDINEDALKLTKDNFLINDININPTLLNSDALESGIVDSLSTKLDLVISNPPMLPVLHPISIFGFRNKPEFWNETEDNGRHVIDSLIKISPLILKPGGKLIFCHTSRIGERKTQKLLDKNFYSWKKMCKKSLVLEPRFDSFLKLWEEDKGSVFKKDGKFFEIFSIIEAVNNG